MELKFPQKESSDLAELIGILLGDGSIGIYQCKERERSHTQHKLQITCNKVDDADYIKYIENLLLKLFGAKPKISYRDKKTCDLRMFDRRIIRFLINEIGMELSPKWNRAKIPNFYLNNDLELKVLRGYFDTDGSVVVTNNNGTVYPRLEMKVCPSIMQTQFIEILNRLGFNFGVYQIGKGKVRIQMNGKKQLSKWVKEIGFSNTKHVLKANKFE